MKNLFAVAALVALGACSQLAQDEAPGEATASATPATPENSTTAATAAYDGPIPMPIRVGGDGPEIDACGTYAEVANLDPAGDNYLSVRDAPSTETKERDRLDAGQGVEVCAIDDGWSGIVYAKEGDEEQDCGTGSPVPEKRNYTGPCRQGWVDSRYLEMIAG